MPRLAIISHTELPLPNEEAANGEFYYDITGPITKLVNHIAYLPVDCLWTIHFDRKTQAARHLRFIGDRRTNKTKQTEILGSCER